MWRSLPFSLALPAAASNFLKEGKKIPCFSTNAIPFFLLCGSQHVPARNPSCHWCGRVPAGSGRELHPPSALLLQPSPTSPWPGCQDWRNWELQEGSRQPASLRGCSQLCLVAQTLLVALTSTSQEVSPPTQSQLHLCEIQLRARTAMELMSFLPVCIGDIPNWGHVIGAEEP